jgi:FSR family fosmidomycin resistance protein-like MFS transporter
VTEPETRGGTGFRAGLVSLLAGAHFLHDIFSSLLAPLLPLLIEKLGLSLVQAGSLNVFSQLASVLNPWLGSWADRHALRRRLVVLGPGATGTLMCLMGLAPSYAILAIFLLSAGFSVAGLHVAAPALIRDLSGRAVGRGMSFFMVAGELARTAGPLLAVPLVTWLGLEGLYKVIPVALLSSLVLWLRLRKVPEPGKSRARVLVLWGRMRGVFVPVAGILMTRAFMAGALTTFLPTFLYGEGESLWMANVSLALLELPGAAGALLSGTLSDRYGRRTLLLAAILASPPLLLLVLASHGPYRLLALGALGFFTLSTTPVLMAFTLERSGDAGAAANGTYMMISFAARALIVLVVGAMGDALGLRETYFWCALFGTLGLPFALMLPRDRPDSADQ